MTLFTINQDKCQKDGLCAAVCPRGIIDITLHESFPQPTADAADFCIACGHCSAVCPHGALELKVMGLVSCPQVEPSLKPGFEQLTQLVRSRRSTRVYKNTPVPRDFMEKLIGLSRYAPTARNSQLLHWLVIDSPETLTEMKEHTIAWMRNQIAQKDPAAIAYGFETVLEAWKEGKDPILRHAPGLVVLHAPAIYPFALVDSTIAMTTFELAAAAEGLGTCWAGFFMIAAKAWKPLRECLQLPEGHALTTAMMTGYPKYKYARLPQRNAPLISWR